MGFAVAGVLAGAAPVPAAAQAAGAGTEPTVTEVPPDAGLHGHPLWDPWFDPGAFGYETHEFLVSGTATATGADTTADYTTRWWSPTRATPTTSPAPSCWTGSTSRPSSRTRSTR